MPEQVIHSKAGEAKVVIKPPVEHIQGHWAKGIFYEGAMLEYIYHHYSGGIFVDVGSSIGNHTLFFAKFCDPSWVASFEPHPESAQHQLENLVLNGVQEQVKLFTVALSDQPGMMGLERFGTHCGQFRLIEGKDIPVSTLDAFASGVLWKGITLIKIDVEGWEYQVLLGALGTINRDSPALFIELATHSEYSKVSNLLGMLGYWPRRKFNQTPTYEFVREQNV